MPGRVPLHGVHEELGARFTGFSGYEMPVLYEGTGIVEEHRAVRGDVGVFDVSHMGNLWIGEGAGFDGDDGGAKAALDALARCTAADAPAVGTGKAKYTAVLREDGTILDDAIFWVTPRGVHMVPNAGRDGDVAAWLEESGGTGAPVDNVTEETCILALQGPRAKELLAEVAPAPAVELDRFACGLFDLADGASPALVSRTGYTGEDGFELIVPADGDGAEALFRRLVDLGATPCGLGARDTLRLEMGYCLAGNEFAGGRTPVEAGLGWLIDWDHAFLGRDVLERQRDEGTDERLVGLLLDEGARGVPRHGCTVVAPEGDANGEGKSEPARDDAPVGEVTSGTHAPTLDRGIALAYVAAPHSKVDTALGVIVRRRALPARVVKPPFVDRS